MNSSTSSQARANALEIIKNYRVSELQTLLDYANVTRQGNKRDLLQRCNILINNNFTPQLANKIHQINGARSRSSRSLQVSSTTTSSSSMRNQPIVIPKTPPLEVLPPANHIQFIHLPFFEKMRTIECSNMPVDWQTFSPLRFVLNETDIDLIRKNSAKVFLRIAPTILHERHNDVLPPYLFVQCNNQLVINNNISKQIGSAAHSTLFPTDITDKIILKPNSTNTLSFTWLQSPTNMSLKSLPRSYTLAVQLVHCVSLETLFESILKRERYSNKTDHDSDIEIEDLGLMTTQHRVSLICPITQSLIVQPVKSSLCSHMTCFDLRAFLQMNERRLQWTCPICKKSAAFDSLRIDESLQTILSKAPANCSTVEINSPTNCQYIFDNIKQEKVDANDGSHFDEHQENDLTNNSPTRSRHQSNEDDCIVLSSGSESEDENELLEQNNNNGDGDDDDDEGEVEEGEVNIQRSTTTLSQSSSHSFPSPIISTNNDEPDWEDFAQPTYDLSSDTNEKYSNRKRTNSSTTSVLSSSSSRSSSSSISNDEHRRTKRSKRSSSQTSDIEIITLSSSDNSDNDDQVS